jgi:hypothetical protein|tara:strand:+ start:2553 stop:3809 length:1257 start_codon:yes stop_codon:yes gene_type:complete
MEKKHHGKHKMNCRFCENPLEHMFIDLGKSPLANSYLKHEDLNNLESFYPLRAFVCSKCFLVQLEEYESPENIFTEYAYMSSYSKSMLNHVENFVEKTIEEFDLSKDSDVIEIASNDGYLLQFFKNKNIPCYGIEPALNVAKIAEEKGIITIKEFFSLKTAKELVNNNKKADVLIAFNVLPHTPNLIDFIEGLKIILKEKGVIIIQFSAYLLPFLQNLEFDTVYHEHFSFFSLYTLEKIFSTYGLTIFDVMEQKIHGGSMRIYLKHAANSSIKISSNVTNQIEKEIEYGVNKLDTYMQFQGKIDELKSKIWEFFLEIKKENKTIVGYGAAAKATTLLNYCGIDKNLLPYVVDANPYKQNRYLPGTHIPIYNPKKIFETNPDYILILAWNLKDEIMKQINKAEQWNGKFVTFIPKVEKY